MIAIEAMMDRYAELYRETREQIAEMDALADGIKKAAREASSTISHGAVTAEWRKPSVRTTWDSKALEGYAAAHPEILPFRTVTETAAAISIKVKGA